MAASAGARRREMLTREALWFEVFGNGLILRNIEKNMGYTDLKKCRQVSRSFNEIILKETSFKRRTIVNVIRGAIEDNVFDNFGWKIEAIRVIPTLYDQCLFKRDKFNRYISKDAFYRQKMSTVYSRITQVSTVMFVQDTCLTPPISQVLLPNVYDTLMATQTLKELKISNEFINLIAQEEQGSAEARNAVQEKIAGLQALDIRVTNVTVPVIPSFSFQQLTSLKKLVIATVVSQRISERDSQLDSGVRTLLEASQGEIEELNLKYVSSTILLGLNLANLKTIDIGVSVGAAEFVERFLDLYRDQLEAVNLSINGTLPDGLLDALNQLNPRLRALGIKIWRHGFQGGRIAVDRYIKLEEFYLVLPSGMKCCNRGLCVNLDYAPVLFGRLPASIKKIGINRPWEQVGLTLPVQKIQGLANVTSLRIEKCSDSLTDPTLQAIFHDMTQLRDLRICEAKKVTDAGFRGIFSVGESESETLQRNSSFSIINLKGLEHLEIRNCDLSDITVIDEIRYLGLRVLDIRRNKRITAASFYAALEQNPSLEQFQIDPVVTITSLKKVATLVRNKYPRLKQCKIIFESPSYLNDDLRSSDDFESDYLMQRAAVLYHAIECLNRVLRRLVDL